MHELELDAADSAELLELIEGEGSCALAYDASARLYDELVERAPSAACLWRLSDDERRELLPELEECAETIERAVLDRLVACLQVSPLIRRPREAPERNVADDFARLRPAK
jgi:hypothetical protein